MNISHRTILISLVVITIGMLSIFELRFLYASEEHIKDPSGLDKRAIHTGFIGTTATPASASRRLPTNTSAPEITATQTAQPTFDVTATMPPTKTRTPSRTITRTPRLTPPPDTLAIRNASFESGVRSWQESSLGRIAIVQRIPAMARTGSWLAILGDAPRERMTVSQFVYVPKRKFTLTFYYKIQSTEACGRFYDVARVYVHTTEVWKLDACKYQVINRWQMAAINLKKYAGLYINLRFHMSTDGLNHSAWFIDDIGWR